jgi:hypothetical protein
MKNGITKSFVACFGFVSILLLLLFISTSASADDRKLAAFSQKATAIWENLPFRGSEPTGTVTVPSPDGKKTVSAAFDRKTDGVALMVSTGSAHFRIKIEGGVGSEIGWSPDSRAFFLTWSSEGQSGEFHVRVYYVYRSGLKKIDLNPLVNRAFGHPPLCLGRSPVNVAAVAWLEGSSRILVAAEVPPHSICDSYGTFKAFEISVPETTILRPYGQLAAKKKFWSDLGPRLRQAPDGCITDPKSCEVRDNHATAN